MSEESGKIGGNHHKHLFVILVVGIFLFLVIGLVYYGYSGNVPLTGSIIGGGGAEIPDNPVDVSLELNFPGENIIVKGDIAEISIEVSRGTPGNNLHVGKQKFDLGDSKDSVIEIAGFKGNLEFNKNNIVVLDGKAGEVIVNGISATPEKGDSMKLSIDQDFVYSSLKVDQFSIKSLSYVASGYVRINDDKINIDLKGDDFSLSNFFGDMQSKKSKFHLDGIAQKVEILGVLEVNAG
jgi:hypothetical protein